jgi:hypothetical protein
LRKRRSKKQSGTSSRREPPKLPPIYIDESLSQGFLWQALKDAGCEVYRRADKFPPGVPDPDWLEEAGRVGWLVLTKDQAITRRRNEMTALVLAGVRAFVLAAGEMTGPDQASLFVRLLPKMREFVKNIRRGPFVVKVSKDRSTQLLHPKKRKRRF